MSIRETVTSSTCTGCGAYCSVLTHVTDGKVTQLGGNPHNLGTGGAVCPALQLTLQQQNDPDRVLTPLRRTNAQKGRHLDPEFQPITWDEALNEIADRMLELRAAGHPEQFVMTKGRSTSISNLIFKALPEVLGSPNSINHDTICAEAEKIGPGNMDGVWAVHDYDFDHVRCIVMWGVDPLVGNRQKSFMLNTFPALCARARIFVVDPHRSLSAQRAGADAWVPIIPGTDAALALAMAHIILCEGIWNRDYVGNFTDEQNHFVSKRLVSISAFTERYTQGLISWWNEELRFRTPEWAENICGVPVERIYEMARTFAHAAPAAVSWISPGVSMTAKGAYSGMCCYALNGLVGSINAQGGVLKFPSAPVTPLPDTVNYRDSIAQQGLACEPIDQYKQRGFIAACGGRIHANRLTDQLADALLTGKPYPVSMLWGYWNNFAFSCPNAHRWELALAKVPFFVHVTTHISESTHFADIVLPAAHHLFECWGSMVGKTHGRVSISLTKPCLPAPGQAKSDEAEIPFMLAQVLARKGFTQLFDYYTKEITDPESGASPTNGTELSLYAVKRVTRPSWERMGGWGVFEQMGVYSTDSTLYADTKKSSNQSVALSTPSGKFEFQGSALPRMVREYADVHQLTLQQAWSDLAYDAPFNLAAFPHWEEPVRVGPQNKYPFIFSQHRSFASLEGRSANTPLFQQMKKIDPGDEPWDDVVKIHPSDMKQLGLQNGQLVRITSPLGSIMVHAKSWDGVLPGVVSKCYGQGHWAYGHVAAWDYERRIPRGGNANEIIPNRYEHFSGSVARHGGIVRVRIEPVSDEEAQTLKYSD